MMAPGDVTASKRWSLSARRLGIASATGIIVVGILYIAVITLWLIIEATPREPIADPYLAVMEVLTMVSALALLGLVIAIWCFAEAARRLAALTTVTVGSTVRFANRDRVYHNVFSVSPAKRFDIGKYAPHQMRQVTFDTPGVVELFCGIDPSMAGFVFVVPHQVFTRPDATGAFLLPKLPRGSYILKAWHPSLGRVSRKVEMPKKGDLVVTLHF